MPVKSKHIVACASFGVLVALAIGLAKRQNPLQPEKTGGNLPAAVPAGTPQPMSPAVLALLSDEPRSLNERLDTLYAIGVALPGPDRQALLQALSRPKLPGLGEDDWFVLANEIMQLLRNQQPAMQELTPALLALWHDASLAPTLRDYALQHLREWVFDQDSRSANETRPERIAEIQQTFLDLIRPENPEFQPSSTTLGTALLALHEWHQPKHAHPMNGSFFEQRLVAILADAGVHRGTRATALQIASQRKLPAALPVAREILRQSSPDVLLSLAAIHYLAANGTSQDRQFLLAYQQQHSTETILQGAIHRALQSLP